MLTVVLADNQRGIAEALNRENAAIHLGERKDWTAHIAPAVTALLANPARREALAWRGRGLVDGRGADRVLERLRAHIARRCSKTAF